MVFEKFTSAYLFQIAREKSCDYLLIIYTINITSNQQILTARVCLVPSTDWLKQTTEAPLGVFGIRDIRGKNYRDTGYLRKKLLGYRILRSSFRDTGYSQKIVTYQMFDEKRSWITKYMPFSVFLLMIRYK